MSIDQRDVRRMMHTVYERYADGVDRYPRYRFTGRPDMYAKKTQPIARAVFGAWERIDEDRIMHKSLVDRAILSYERTGAVLNTLVVNKVGRNAVRLFQFIDDDGAPKAVFGEFDATEFVEEFDGFTWRRADGETLTLANGTLESTVPFDAMLVRQSNVTAISVSREPA